MASQLNVSSLFGVAAVTIFALPAMALPVPVPVSSLRSLDIDLEVPGFEREIHGFSSFDLVVCTRPVFAARAAEVDEAQGPMLRAFHLSETESGASGCRWIAGWADLTARGFFGGSGGGTLVEASGLGGSGHGLGLEGSSSPRWYLALRTQ